MLEVASDYDMVIGSRYLNESIKEYSLLRRIGIRFFTSVVNFFGGIDITDVTSGFRVYRVSALKNILHRSDDHWAVEQTLEAAKSGQRIHELSVAMPTREKGRSQFSPKTFVFYPVRMADVLFRILIFR